MRTFNLVDYPNFLISFDLSSNQILYQIKDIPLEFYRVRNQEVEWKIRFPTFLTTFYNHIKNSRRIISQSEFFDLYLEDNQAFFKQRRFSEEIIFGLKARVFRTYPSLVRDIHFSVFLKENLTKGKVVYNQELDVLEGIDLMIIFNNMNFGINLFTKTSRGFMGREKKAFRHNKFSNVNYIEMPVEFNGSVKCGKFFLYGERELSNIKSIIL